MGGGAYELLVILYRKIRGRAQREPAYPNIRTLHSWNMGPSQAHKAVKGKGGGTMKKGGQGAVKNGGAARKPKSVQYSFPAPCLFALVTARSRTCANIGVVLPGCGEGYGAGRKGAGPDPCEERARQARLPGAPGPCDDGYVILFLSSNSTILVLRSAARKNPTGG